MRSFQQLERAPKAPRTRKAWYTLAGLLGVLLFCGLGIVWKHHSWLWAPNDYMLVEGGDGLKNYFTSAYHVRYDSTYLHYSGMNYPFGEHVLFTDNQPVFSAFLQWWGRHIWDTAGWAVGATNLFLVVSMLLAAAVLFLLGRKLNLPVWYAGIIAVAMVFLSPQQDRINGHGHFGLFHPFVIPLILLLLLYYEERYSKRYLALLIGVVVFFSAQLHFYFFGMAALFLSLYTGFQILHDFSYRTVFKRLAHWIVMVILPFAALNIWLRWTDFAADRPSNPYGFLVYIGHWEGVLLPPSGFSLHTWINKHIVAIRAVSGEAVAYAGAVATLFSAWLLVSGFRMFGRSWSQSAHHRVSKHFLWGIFVAALLLLLFSCGFPFAIKGMEWMVDYMGPLRQFRGLGRFSWVYFYVVNILAFYSIWNWHVRFNGIRGGRAIWLKYPVLVLPLVILVLESVAMQRHIQIALSPNLDKRDLAAAEPNHWLNQVDFSPFQALLPLPYYHMGSENIWWEVNTALFARVQATALHTGVPDMGVNMSRTSARQTVESMQFVLEPCESPAMLNELPDNRPIALMIKQSEWKDVAFNYPHLVRKALPVYEDLDMKIMALYPDSLRRYIREHVAEVRNQLEKDSLPQKDGWMVTSTAWPLVHTTFDDHSSDRVFQGRGAFRGNMQDTAVLYRGALTKGNYYINFWTFANQDLGLCHELHFYETDPRTGAIRKEQHEGVRFHTKTLVNGWALYDIPFEVTANDSELFIFLYNKNANQTFYLDEMLIKNSGMTAFRRKPGWLIRNNFWYRE